MRDAKRRFGRAMQAIRRRMRRFLRAARVRDEEWKRIRRCGGGNPPPVDHAIRPPPTPAPPPRLYDDAGRRTP